MSSSKHSSPTITFGGRPKSGVGNNSNNNNNNNSSSNNISGGGGGGSSSNNANGVGVKNTLPTIKPSGSVTMLEVPATAPGTGRRKSISSPQGNPLNSVGSSSNVNNSNASNSGTDFSGRSSLGGSPVNHLVSHSSGNLSGYGNDIGKSSRGNSNNNNDLSPNMAASSVAAATAILTHDHGNSSIHASHPPLNSNNTHRTANSNVNKNFNGNAMNGRVPQSMPVHRRAHYLKEKEAEQQNKQQSKGLSSTRNVMSSSKLTSYGLGKHPLSTGVLPSPTADIDDDDDSNSNTNMGSHMNNGQSSSSPTGSVTNSRSRAMGSFQSQVNLQAIAASNNAAGDSSNNINAGGNNDNVGNNGQYQARPSLMRASQSVPNIYAMGIASPATPCTTDELPPVKVEEATSATGKLINGKVRVGGLIGTGSYGAVYTCKLEGKAKEWEKTVGRDLAIKIISKARLNQDGDGSSLLKKEIKIMALLDHPNIVRLHHTWSDSENYYLLMDHAPRGDAFDVVELYTKGTPEPLCARIMSQVFSALSYLHSMGVVHRDVKPENLFIDNGGNVLLGDFGLADVVPTKRDGSRSKLTSVCGSETYQAPEMIINHVYGVEVDVWSAGLTMYTLITGRDPWKKLDRQMTQAELRKKIATAAYNTLPSHISKSAADLLNCMLTVNPEKRISAEQALEHNWMRFADFA